MDWISYQEAGVFPKREQKNDHSLGGGLTNRMACDKNINRELTQSQVKFLDYCQIFCYGKIEVDVKDGQPVGARVVVKENVVQQYIKFD